MPFVHIRTIGPRLEASRLQHLQGETTRLMADVLNKKAELTAVLVEEFGEELGENERSRASWTIGGVGVSPAAHLEVSVTAGTNTPAEKANFIAAAAALLRSVLGKSLPVATYVVVQEVVADAWGYDGLSQEARRPAGPAAQAGTGG